MGLIPWRNKEADAAESSGAAPALMQFRGEVDRLFDRFMRNPWSFFDQDAWGGGWSGWLPSVDVNESENDFSVRVEIPGVDPKDLDISLAGRVLTIQGEKKEEGEDKGKGCYRSERRFGSFKRAIELPESVKEDGISADYKNGVLTIKAEKEPGAKKKRIAIQTS